MNEISKIDLKCSNCGKINKVSFIRGFIHSYRAKGTTGISHLVTTSKTSKIIGYCECGYKYKKSDME